jgi:hypothetical protein
MNIKVIIALILVAVIVSAGVAGAYLIMKQDRVNEIKTPEGRFKMDISGMIGYGFAGITGWSVTATYDVNKMTEADAGGLEILGFWDPWNSGPLKIKAVLKSTSAYTQTFDVEGSMNVWAGGSKPFALLITMIVPNTSPFTLTLTLYEDNVARASKVFTGIKILPANG